MFHEGLPSFAVCSQLVLQYQTKTYHPIYGELSYLTRRAD